MGRAGIGLFFVGMGLFGCAGGTGGRTHGDAGTPPVDDDAGAAAVCGDGHVDPGEACDDGNTDPYDGCLEDCTEWREALGDPLPASDPHGWEWIEIEGARCRDGSPAGFAINRSASSRNVMIYLEGGGACFDELCDVTALDVPFVPPYDGIFDRNVETNPVRDWNMVYVPYCTGDVYGGDREDAVIETAAGPIVSQFVGYRNVGLFLDRLVPTFRDADQVLLTGISAGGFGAGLNAERTQRAFGPVPVVLVDDSGPPMSGQALPRCLQRTFREVWNFDATILALCGDDCPDHDEYVDDYFHHVARGLRAGARGGLYSSTGDAVIRTFYGAGQNDCSGGMVPAEVYRDELMALRADAIATGAPFGSFLVDGIGHTALRTPSFYATQVGDTTLAEWVGDLLGGRVEHVGP